MSPVVMPEERRGSPHSPQLTHTHRGHQLGEVGRAGARCPSQPHSPGKGGCPSSPKRPRSPSAGMQTPSGARTESRALLVCPRSAQPQPGAPHPAGSRSAEPSEPRHLQSLEAPAAATYQHVPLHFSRLKHCLFLHLCRVCACVCCSPRVT